MRKLNSPCRNPFLSKKTTSCRSDLPAPPPSKPKRCVPAIRLPEGRHASGCSSPGIGSIVACSFACRSNTRRTRRGRLVSCGVENAETTKYEPSPRQLMRGAWSSSGLEPTLDVGFSCAAAFPKEPWNWVCLDPHPTFMGASRSRVNEMRDRHTDSCHLLHSLPYVRGPPIARQTRRS